jgi:hypothetical protein
MLVAMHHHYWLMRPANKEPKIGPVQEKETMAKVRAIKNIPAKSPNPDLESTLLAKELGKPISNSPKKDKAKTINTAKNNRFNTTLVERLFNISGFVSSIK